MRRKFAVRSRTIELSQGSLLVYFDDPLRESHLNLLMKSAIIIRRLRLVGSSPVITDRLHVNASGEKRWGIIVVQLGRLEKMRVSFSFIRFLSLNSSSPIRIFFFSFLSSLFPFSRIYVWIEKYRAKYTSAFRSPISLPPLYIYKYTSELPQLSILIGTWKNFNCFTNSVKDETLNHG